MEDGSGEMYRGPEKLSSKENESPREYFEVAYNFIKTNAYKRDALDETDIRRITDPILSDTTDLYDAQRAIAIVLWKLGDSHSFLFTKVEQQKYLSQPEHERQQLPERKLLNGEIAYLSIPGLSGLESGLIQKYADSIQNFIREYDQKNPKGWVVDLRKNDGGTMYPMIAGLGPLIGEGTAGYFLDKDGNKGPFSYEKGTSYGGKIPSTTITEPYTLQHPEKKIAVLTSNITGSSGEFTLICFKGKGNVKTFGEATRGVPTGNETVSLSDGTWLNVCTSISADRTGKTYDSSIPPDEEVKINWQHIGDDNDPVLRSATEWIRES